MAHKLSEEWQQDFYGPFVRRDGSEVSLSARSVEGGFVMYTAFDGTKYHASGVVAVGDAALEIDGRVTRPDVPFEKAPTKTRKKRVTDTRLQHLLKVQKEVQRDVARYVSRKWPPNAKITYEHHNEVRKGEVAGHDMPMQTVVVFDGPERRKLRVAYHQIHDRRAKGL